MSEISEPFAWANRCTTHLIVQPADLRLDPPESYLFIQDGLIISCGVLYALCYFFYMARTYRDKTVAGPVEYTCGTMAYELFYAFATTSTSFELASFLVWFLLDFTFATIAIISAYTPARRPAVIKRMVCGILLGLVMLLILTHMFPDEREQVTAYWTGLLLQFPIGWGSLYLLLRDRDTKGQSLEIRLTRYLGCLSAYGVFVWRYVNLPENWSYLGSTWSVGIIALTMIPETVFPFVYIWVDKAEKAKVA